MKLVRWVIGHDVGLLCRRDLHVLLEREPMNLFRRKKRDQRYVARSLNWRPFLGVETGVVDDTRPDEPTAIDHDGPGFKYVTTYSNAKRLARKANRLEKS